MKTDQLNRQLNNLTDDIKEYYDNFISQQEQSIILDENDIYFIDYLGNSTGIYNEAQLKELNKENIVVFDRELGEDVEIDFLQVNLTDRITILEIYEENKLL